MIWTILCALAIANKVLDTVIWQCMTDDRIARIRKVCLTYLAVTPLVHLCELRYMWRTANTLTLGPVPIAPAMARVPLRGTVLINAQTHNSGGTVHCARALHRARFNARWPGAAAMVPTRGGIGA